MSTDRRDDFRVAESRSSAAVMASPWTMIPPSRLTTTDVGQLGSVGFVQGLDGADPRVISKEELMP
jgi:hypothetical protein